MQGIGVDTFLLYTSRLVVLEPVHMPWGNVAYSILRIR